MATQCCSFELHTSVGRARAGTLTLTHGSVPTPNFMPVGTRGTVRGMTPSMLRNAGADIVLANTYHLWVRPGHEIIRELGGLHAFMRWDGPILTDSGGYQVFSMRDRLKVTEKGARIRSPEDNAYRTLTPELAVEIQEALGVDIAMAFDECLEWPATEERSRRSTERTTRWLKRCLNAREHADRTALFGIVQGGMFADLRRAHADELAALDLDGYAIGGLSVGEGGEAMREMTDLSAERLPEDKVRYLMGVGHPLDIVDAVLSGVDLFDCVLPTRAGRHATIYTRFGRLNLRNARFRTDPEVLEPGCSCTACSGGFSRAYLKHLDKCNESLGQNLMTEHNLTFYLRMMKDLRKAILNESPGEVDAVRALAERANKAA